MKPTSRANKRARHIRDRRYAGEITEEQALISLRALVGEYRGEVPYKHTRADIDADADALARQFLDLDLRQD